MNLEKIKKIVKSYMFKKYSFIYKGSRNQIDKFDGVIVQCFPSIFLVKTNKGVLKSFSYNDFIMKNIKIINK